MRLVCPEDVLGETVGDPVSRGPASAVGSREMGRLGVAEFSPKNTTRSRPSHVHSKIGGLIRACPELLTRAQKTAGGDEGCEVPLKQYVAPRGGTD
jgi:hypothetical protein